MSKSDLVGEPHAGDGALEHVALVDAVLVHQVEDAEAHAFTPIGFDNCIYRYAILTVNSPSDADDDLAAVRADDLARDEVGGGETRNATV